MSPFIFPLARHSTASIIFAAAVCFSLFYNGRSIHWFSLSWFALLAWFAYQLIQKKSVDLRILPIHVISLLCIAWLVIALYWHPIPWYGTVFNWRMSTFFFVFLSTCFLFAKDDTNKTIKTLLIVGFVVAILTLYQSFYLKTEDAAATFFNRNQNGAFLNLFILPLMGLFLISDKSGASYWLKALSLFLLLLAALQTSSRGAFLGLFIATALLLTAALFNQRKKGVAAILLILLLAFLSDQTLSPVPLTETPKMFNTVSDDSSMEQRFRLWNSTVQMIHESPWQGVGNGTFWLLYPQYRDPNETSSGYFVHNDYLQVLLELGIPGLALLVSLLVSASMLAFFLVRRTNSKTEKIWYTSLFAALLAIAVHSVFTFNFYITPILIICGLYLAAITQRCAESCSKFVYSIKIALNNKQRFILILLLLLPAQYFFGIGYAYAMTHGVLFSTMEGKTVKEQYQILQRASKIDTLNYWYPLVTAILLSNAGEQTDPDEKQLIYDESLSSLRAARKLNPYSPETYYHEASLYLRYSEIKGKDWFTDALPLADKALQLNPRTFQARIIKAKLYEKAGKVEQALDTMLQGIDTIYANTTELPSYFFYGKELAEKVGDERAIRAFQANIEKGKWNTKDQI